MARILVTGGAGFIGVNAAIGFDRDGWEVVILDNLSRAGSAQNRAWLLQHHAKVKAIEADVRDAARMQAVVRQYRPDVVLHLAAQVAVTTSVTDPRTDFEINALGTLNLLEAVRQEQPEAFFIYSSTNKVYGKLAEVATVEREHRHEFKTLVQGVDERAPLDFYSPYGCSKGVADQYTLDYSRIYGLQTVSFRQSCIYGPHQMGVEDQGWVAWFCIAALGGRRITLYGDGKQVRDLLHVEDLVSAYRLAVEARERVSGRAFNIGGGPDRTLSLLELLAILEAEIGRPVEHAHAAPRPGDQPVFVCDVRAAATEFGWRPKMVPAQGVRELVVWLGGQQLPRIASM